MLLLGISLIFDFLYHYFSINIVANDSVKNIVLLIDRISGGVLTAAETIVFSYFIFSIYKIQIIKKHIIVLASVFGFVICGYFSINFGLKNIYGFDIATVLNYSINEGSRVFLVIFLLKLFFKNRNPQKRKLIQIQNRISLFFIIIFSSLLLGDTLHFLIKYNHQAYYLTSSIYYLIFLALPVIHFTKYTKILNPNIENIDISLSPINSQMINEYNITPREQEVLNLIVNGKTNKEISNMLFISYQTVKDHNYRIFKKFNVNSRVHLIQSLINTQISA